MALAPEVERLSDESAGADDLDGLRRILAEAGRLNELAARLERCCPAPVKDAGR